ncbi:LysR family transcriptional regulator [Ktedonosporobacter rubrisoli]|uniref:LysR family transcriptional regulator n=1 Tax=Ktedonosporobacter rubrisoli TaxID=2509675 RepID=A0A4P6JLM5_KTERU|nr:LysR family transcriptional regulator [Ktedonosporobacter rubrisoli]QBD76157.1 LysR family transcriptional regulator [Ktedonosporobacter rubrisoli]
MDLHQLQAFDQIVLYSSFSKAARKLGVSQPTISLRIRALEQEVGGALFQRNGRHLSLTELGQSFLPYTQTALRAMTTGIDVARRTHEGERGQLRIATLPSLAAGFFATALARFYHDHPHIDVAIHTGHTQEICEMLYEHYVHLGFVVGPFFHPELSPLLSLKEPLILVTYPEHPLAQAEHITLAEIVSQGQPFFLIDWNVEVKRWQSHLLSAAPSSTIEVPPQTAYDLLMSGQGVALLTRAMVEQEVKTGRLVELHAQQIPQFHRESLLMHYTTVSSLPTAVKVWLRFFREEARHYCLDSR